MFFRSMDPPVDETLPLVDKRLPSTHLSMELFERMMDILEKETAYDSIVTIPQAETLFQSSIPQLYRMFPTKGRQGVVNVTYVIHEVYNHWVKRRSTLRRPLLRRFWPITSTEDLNPHMVFRPREKEKYKLRKKRQNDFNAYRKLKQLRDDMDNLRMILDVVRHREKLHELHVQLQVDLYQQRLYDAIDSSSIPRPSKWLCQDQVSKLLNETPNCFDVNLRGRKAKRVRPNGFPPSLPSTSAPFSNVANDFGKSLGNGAGVKVMIAGRNNGDPAPNFLQSLPTRESYVSSWEGVAPYIPTYEDAQLHPTFRFRHRPRLGRGGRICVDRVPQPIPEQLNLLTDTVYTAGNGMRNTIEPRKSLLEFLPKPLDYKAISRRIEALSVAAMKEDYESRKINEVSAGELEEDDTEEVIVKLDDWLETDEQQWGDERYVIGPI
jgi:enhancer of polycomb-like protein